MEYIKILKPGNRFSIGEMQHCEGELMNITVNNPDYFCVGDLIQCHCFGINFETKILKKVNNHIFIHAPIFHSKFPEERRKLPRIQVDLNAYINDCISTQLYDIPVDNHVKVIDLNIKGFGILTTEPLKKNFFYYLHVELGEKMVKPKVIIRNELIFDEGFRYGCEIHSITQKEFKALRSFILMRQLTNNLNMVH